MERFKPKNKLEADEFYYSEEGFIIFTEAYHLKRGYCCKNHCKHCPYGFDKKRGVASCYSNKEIKVGDSIVIGRNTNVNGEIELIPTNRFDILEFVEENEGRCGFKYHYKFKTKLTELIEKK